MKEKLSKKMNIIEGMLKSINGLATGEVERRRDYALRDEWDDIVIDTVRPCDTNVWETGIRRLNIEGIWVIVEQYNDSDEAKIGHKKWVDLLKKNPKAKLEDINIFDI